jgi:hypothetical protein
MCKELTVICVLWEHIKIFQIKLPAFGVKTVLYPANKDSLNVQSVLLGRSCQIIDQPAFSAKQALSAKPKVFNVQIVLLELSLNTLLFYACLVKLDHLQETLHIKSQNGNIYMGATSDLKRRLKSDIPYTTITKID